ncbi:MAG: ParB/RepB/Spo0J family partition protein [Defluviitaleaceae bacterium]|nr:ParB/RepB/Spo0J family partition protein [Defluviitaleaceae bacterium]
MQKKVLGRGLGALLDANNEPNGAASGITVIDIRKIEPNVQQPRQYFDEDALKELADSIGRYGVLQPLIVKDCGDYYSIIAGERRFRAARMAGLSEIPALVKEATELDVLQIALIENIQRQDLTPIEEAVCFKRLIDDFFFTQEDVAQKIGKKRGAVSNAVRLLDLDARVQDFVSEGRLTAGHARTLLQIKDNDLQLKCAEAVIKNDMSVREAEKLVQNTDKNKAEDEKKAEGEPDALSRASQLAIKRAENALSEFFGSKVNILSGVKNGKTKGRIEIEYDSADELERLLALLKGAGA